MLKRLTRSGGSALNVNFSADALKGMVNAVWQDLKAKRLWPVAVLLLLGVVAAPVLLSKSAGTPPPAPPVAAAPPPVPGLPAVTQRPLTPSQLRGTKRDPFAAQSPSSPTSPAAPAGAGSASVAGSTGAAVGSATGAGAPAPAPSSGGGSPTSTTPGTTTTGGGSSPSGGATGPGGSGGKTPPPPPSGLDARQSYAVRLAISNSSGGIKTLDPLQRLSVLPSEQQPLMVELGVLKGGSRVLFALEPGAAVSGPGQCIPGPINCQIVSLSRNQVEHVGIHSHAGFVPAAMFAVTGISVVTHGTVAEADQARRDESAAGRTLLSRSSSSALSLFQYQLSVGAVVDMRNLTFGVNS